MSDNNTNLETLIKDLEVTPCDNIDQYGFKKLDLTSDQKSKVSMLVSQIPQLTAADTLSNAYRVKFPEGVTGTLMKYKNGGFGSPIQGEKGVVGHASFFELESYSSVLTAFSVISIVTGQYFLNDISNKFQIINLKMDQIIEFLYGEKRAELIAEISFVKETCMNFNSIMKFGEQRVATIASLQASRKVAMRDIEFYLSDLNAKVSIKNSSYKDFTKNSNDTFSIKNCLELALQLYAISNIMEILISQNTEHDYLTNVKCTTLQYINKCEKRMLSDFANLLGQNNRFKDSKKLKVDTDTLGRRFMEVVDNLDDGDKSELSTAINSAMDAMSKPAEYCITKSGELYMKTP